MVLILRGLQQSRLNLIDGRRDEVSCTNKANSGKCLIVIDKGLSVIDYQLFPNINYSMYFYFIFSTIHCIPPHRRNGFISGQYLCLEIEKVGPSATRQHLGH